MFLPKGVAHGYGDEAFEFGRGSIADIGCTSPLTYLPQTFPTLTHASITVFDRSLVHHHSLVQ